MNHIVLSGARAKIWITPLEFTTTLGESSKVPCKVVQPDHDDEPADVWAICHRAWSVPRTNASMRPSVFTATAGSAVICPPSSAQFPQTLAPPEDCAMVQSELSPPSANA